jgi:hypothetical protein
MIGGAAGRERGPPGKGARSRQSESASGTDRYGQICYRSCARAWGYPVYAYRSVPVQSSEPRLFLFRNLIPTKQRLLFFLAREHPFRSSLSPKALDVSGSSPM